MHGLKFAFLFLTVLVYRSAKAQSSVSLSQTDSVTIAANPELQANGLHRFLFGSLWRDVWATPVKVEILNLDSSADNLSFDKMLLRIHQGNVTRSLLFKDKNGNEHTFTPINQDSSSSLPPELSVLLPHDIVDDQIKYFESFCSTRCNPDYESRRISFSGSTAYLSSR